MFGKRVLAVAAAVLVVTACVTAWFGFNWYQRDHAHGSGGATQQAHGYEMTVTEGKNLTDRLVSQDAATYKSAWAHGNVPPKAPPGTTVRVTGKLPVTFPYRAGKIEAEVTVPGKKPVGVMLYLVRPHDRWLLVTMKER